MWFLEGSRPDRKSLQCAKRRLVAIPQQWARRRLKIIKALLEHPKATYGKIAWLAGTRTDVVRKCMLRARDEGPQTLWRYGRPLELDDSTLQRLRRRGGKARFANLAAAKDWFILETKWRLSDGTVRRLCKLLGIQLRSQATRGKEGIGGKHRWTKRQLADLAKHPIGFKKRAEALALVGTTTTMSLRSIARSKQVHLSALREDLGHFLSGGMGEVIRHTRFRLSPRENVLPDLFKWCDAQWRRTHNLPSGPSARRYLKDKHGLDVPLSTTYIHLGQWRDLRGHIRKPRQTERRYKPSAGLEVVRPLTSWR